MHIASKYSINIKLKINAGSFWFNNLIKIMKKYIKILKDPKKYLRAFFILILSKCYFIPDKLYLKKIYKLAMNKKLNLKDPKTYNEKLQWLKLYDRKPEYTTMVDKVDVKDYVAKIIGEEYIIPTIGVYEKFNDIDFDKLPNQFVMKCTHDSGGLVICKDKFKLNINEARKKINYYLKRKYFYCWREWPYKDVKPRIIIEKYMEDESVGDLIDYKLFCFDGEVKALFIALDRSNPDEETKFDFFDSEFKPIALINGHPNSGKETKKPIQFEEMKQLASKLSKGISHVRVDFYIINEHIYFGELTFTHWSGIVPFEPEEWDYTFGSWIKLPENGINKNEK